MKKTIGIILGIIIIGAISFYAYWKTTQKTIAILLYDDFIMLEAIGAYQTFSGLMMKNYKIKFVAKEKGIVKSIHIQSLEVVHDFGEITETDILYIPGGDNMEKVLRDTSILNWIKAVDKKSKFTMSVGGGTLLLAKAGILKNKKAATHWYHQKELEKYGTNYMNENYIIDGKYYIGTGVSAAIDMVLALIKDIAGADYSKATQLFIEYDPLPPVRSGNFEQADSAVSTIAQQLVEGNFMDTIFNKKNIAMMLYEGFTMLDMTGPYQVFKELEPMGYEMKFVAKEKGIVLSDMMLSYQADYVFEELNNADILFIPGGSATPEIMKNNIAMNWVKKMDETTIYTTSVCTGSLVLAKAGLLEDRNAACHWYAGQFLKDYQVHFSQERYTIDGKYLTGAGVSSGIDLALFVVKEAVGEEYAKAIQLKLGYFPNPPFDAGSPEKSEKKTKEWLGKMFESSKEKYKAAKNER